MPDLGPFVGALADLLRPVLGPLVRVALRAMLRTALGMFVLAVATTAGAYLLGARSSPTRGAIAAGISVAVFLVVGLFQLVRSGVGRAIAHGLGTLGLGEKLVGLLFDGLLRIDGEGTAGDRGHAAQKAIERLPLGEIERRLRTLVASVTGSGEGFVSSRIRSALLVRVATFTLAELRAEGDSGGGVDLVRARQRVEEAVQRGLVAKIERTLALASVVFALLGVAISLSIAALLGRR